MGILSRKSHNFFKNINFFFKIYTKSHFLSKIILIYTKLFKFFDKGFNKKDQKSFALNLKNLGQKFEIENLNLNCKN